jgi:Cysteine-rich secretory protein family
MKYFLVLLCFLTFSSNVDATTDKYGDSSEFLKKSKVFYDLIKNDWPDEIKIPVYSKNLSLTVIELLKKTKNRSNIKNIKKIANSLGLISTRFIPYTVKNKLGTRKQLALKTIKTLKKYIKYRKITHFGFKLFMFGSSKYLFLLMEKRSFIYQPFSKKVDRDDDLTITGKIDKKYPYVKIVISKPGVKRKRKKIKTKNGKFSITTTICGIGDEGVYKIDILGQTNHRSTGVADFPIFCGVEINHSSKKIKLRKFSKMGTIQFAVKVFKGVNKYRKKKKLPALNWNDDLSKISISHSNEMCKLNKLAHVSPTTGNAANRAKKYGLKPKIIGENLAFTVSPEETVTGWIESDGHRRTMEHKKVKEAGVGICRKALGNGKFTYYSTLLVALF